MDIVLRFSEGCRDMGRGVVTSLAGSSATTQP